MPDPRPGSGEVRIRIAVDLVGKGVAEDWDEIALAHDLVEHPRGPGRTVVTL